MMRWVLGSVAALAVIAGTAWVAMGPEWRALVAHLPTNRDVLFWTVPQRDAAFRMLDRLPVLAESAPISASQAPRALPPGAPLAVPQADVEAYMADQRVAGLVVIHKGQLRLERYGLDFSAVGRWTSFSVAKSLTSTLVGAAVADGAIRSLDDAVSTYVQGLKGSAYDDVTVRQLLTMSSGVRWNEDYEDPQSDVARFNSHTAAPGEDVTVSYLKTLPRAHPPGTVWNYNTGETNLIGVLVREATGKPLAAYLQEKIWQPFGMEADATWILGTTGAEIGGCCIQAATRDYARFGLFVLEGGMAGGRQVVPDDWFAQATRTILPIGVPGAGYGFQWWTFDDGSFEAQGIFGQGIFIDPARQLVVAVNSNWPRATGQDAGNNAFYNTIRAAIDAETAAAAAPAPAEPAPSVP